MDSDDDGRWKAGLFYFNPEDPEIFVRKRSGFGRTVNYAHPVSWLLTVVLPLAVVVLVALTRR